ncbi:MAG: transketolase [Christensenella sp.]|nr:transketolase [Christensenella sp.]
MKTIEERVSEVQDKCRQIRKYTLEMTLEVPGGVHFGPSYSIIDIIGALYFDVMNFDPKNPRDENRDRLILSKGHGCAGLYPALALAGFFPLDDLKKYGKDDSPLGMHPSMDMDHGIEASTGSLGQGISFGAGVALAGKINGKDYRTFVIVGNGECNEGQVWECAMSAAQYKLDNLVVIVDDNGMQCDHESRTICDMGDIAEKWRAFGWEAVTVDGHDIEQLIRVLASKRQPMGKPLAVIAKTVKGKGISFFEDNNDWHHTHFVTKEIFDRAMANLD